MTNYLKNLIKVVFLYLKITYTDISRSRNTCINQYI